MKCLVLALLVFSQVEPTPEARPKRLEIDVCHFAPLVMVDAAGNSSGLEIKLLERFAESKGLQPHFNPVANFPDVFTRVRSGEVPIAAAGISVRSEREREVDFSHPTLHSSISLLVRSAPRSFWSSTAEWLRTIRPTVIFVIGFVLVAAHLVWWAELGEPEFHDKYFRGIGDTVWFVFVLIVSVGIAEKFTRRARGRVITAGIIIVWLLVGANLVSDLSVFKLMRQDVPEIGHPRDLAGHTVATVFGTTSVKIAADYGADVHAVNSIDVAVKLLERRKVDAVVFDTPVLKRFTGSGLVIAGVVAEEDYAVAFALDSPLQEDFNRFLLSMRESGEYDALERKYLGD